MAFGTIDTFLLWRLTDGASHKTDATNAARTCLFNIHTQSWDAELLEVFGVSESLLPEVCDCAADFGLTDAGVFGASVPVAGMAGDQQAALIGQACFTPGMIKSTYGTGCFMILNTGETPVTSENRLLTTVAYRLKGKTTYALEGSIFIAGASGLNLMCPKLCTACHVFRKLQASSLFRVWASFRTNSKPQMSPGSGVSAPSSANGIANSPCQPVAVGVAAYCQAVSHDLSML